MLKVLKFECVKGFENAVLPVRKTKASAGYDICAYVGGHIAPGETKLVPTGIKCKMNDDEYLQLHLRSSVGVKFDVILANGTGIIDADYYNNEDNDGHIMIPIRNIGNSTFAYKAGERLAQLVIMKYQTTIDDNATEIRNGGFGSTGK